jgi:protein SCO1/2
MPRRNAFKLLLTRHKWTVLGLFIVILMFMIVQFVKEANEVALRRQLIKQQGQSGESTGQAAIGGSFELMDQYGNSFSENNLIDKYSLLFFGYTFCPDICPNTLSTVAEVYDSLSPSLRSSLQVIFVTVDPQRDTADVMQEYMAAFHADFIGLRGTDDALKQMARAYKIYYTRGEGEGADYLMNHSGFVYLMGPQGEFLKHWPHHVKVQTLRDDLQKILYK